MIRLRLISVLAALAAGVAMALAVPAHAEGNLTLTAAGELLTGKPAGHPAGLAEAMTPAAQAAMTPVVNPAEATTTAPLPAPVAQSDKPVPYVYMARGVRDPFMPPIEIRAPQVEEAVALPELQRYPIGDFTLIGIIWTQSRKSAMVSTPDGKGHTIKVGTRIGTQEGKVRRITREAVIIEEFRTDVFGERKKYETVLALRPEEVIP